MLLYTSQRLPNELAIARPLPAQVVPASVVASISARSDTVSGPTSVCIQNKDNDLAIKSCTEFIQQATSNKVALRTAYHRRSVAYAVKRHYDHAIADVTKAIELNNRMADAYVTRGFIRVNSNRDHADAIIDFTKAIELDPAFSQAYIGRGIAYTETDNLSEAIADFSQAIALSDDDAGSYHGRARALWKAGRLVEALSDAERSLELRPNHASTLNTRGNIFLSLGQREEAIADFRRALSKNPDLQESRAALKQLRVSPLPSKLRVLLDSRRMNGTFHQPAASKPALVGDRDTAD